MLVRLSHDLGGYVYDVFVTRMDLWVMFGLAAQLVFGARFIVQWIASERAGRSIIPMSFWILSMAGGVMTLAYGIVRREPIIIFGQIVSTVIYLRNIALVLKERRAARRAS